MLVVRTPLVGITIAVALLIVENLGALGYIEREQVESVAEPTVDALIEEIRRTGKRGRICFVERSTASTDVNATKLTLEDL